MQKNYTPQKYFSVLDEPVLVIAFDEQKNLFNFVFSNIRAQEILQYSESEIRTLSVEALFFKNYIPEIFASAHAACTLEMSLKTKHGSMVKFDIFPNVIPSNDFYYFELICITRSIKDEHISDLQLAHNRFYTMAAHLHEGLTILENRRIVFTNKAVENITGYGAHEILTLTESVEYLAAPDEKSRVKQLLADMQNNPEENHTIDFWIVTKHGQRKFIHNSYSQFITRDGVVQYVVTQDVTLQKRAELVIKQKEKEFVTLAENLNQVVIIFDRELQCLYINKAGAKLLGTEPPLIVERKLNEIHGFAYNYQEIKYSLIQVFSDQQNVNQIISFEANNEVSILECVFIPASFVEGVIDTAFVVMTDITELAEMKNELENLKYRNGLILNDLIDMVWLLDQKFNISYVSPSVERLTGYTVEEYPALSYEQVFEPDGVEMLSALYQNISQGVKTGNVSQLKQAFVITTRQYRKDNSLVWVELVARPLFDKSDNFVGVSGVTRDISKRKVSELALVEAKEKAIEADRLKSAFLANMSHEIRTPMNAIIGFADLLNEGDVEADSKAEYIELINSNSVHLLKLIDDIIDISKIEAGEITVKKVEVSVLSMFKDLLASNNEMLKKLGKFDVELKYSPIDPYIKVLTDPVRLQQILINLISNSIKFTNRGTIEFGMSVHDKNYARFYVSDTGIGMSQEKLIFIFDRFRQVDEHISRKYQGSGLGLSISKQLVELMGGEIWVESIEGQGTTFYFTLPHQWDEEVSVSQVVAASGDEVFNVMIVEDEDTNFQLLKEMLKNKNLRLFRAHDGLEALDIVRDEQLDLILMDIQLPKMDGYEATRRIREILPNLPIIAQTAYANYNDVVKSLEAGCNDFIAKPIKMKKLLTMIDKYL